MALPYLKRVNLDSINGLSAWYGGFTATSERIYLVDNGSPEAYVRVFDKAGARVASEDKQIQGSSDSNRFYTGLAVDETHLYTLRAASHQNVLLVDVYNIASGTQGAGFGQTFGQEYPIAPTGLLLTDLKFWIGLTFRNVAEQRNDRWMLRINQNGNADFSAQLPRSFFTSFETLDFTLMGNTVYVLSPNDKQIYIADRLFAFTGEEGPTLHADNDAPIAVANNGNAVMVYDEDDHAVYYYGSEAPPVFDPTTIPPQQQYESLEEWERTIDVARLNQNNVSVLRAVNMPALSMSTAAFISVTSDVTVADQTNNYTFVPKFTIPGVRIGDFIQFNIGGTKENPPTVFPGTGVYLVEGVREAGFGKRQVIACVLV